MYRIYSLFSLLFVFISASVYIFIDTVVSNGDKTRWIFPYVIITVLILILHILLLRIIYRYYIGVKSCKLNIIDLTLRNEDLMVKNDNLLEDRNRILGAIIEELSICYTSIKDANSKLNTIDRELKHFEFLLKQLNIYYRQENGKEYICLTSFSLKDLMCELNQECQEMFMSSGNAFTIDSFGEDMLFTDKAKIKHICRELLSNAYKYTKNGDISFTVETDKDCLSLSVCDSGAGFDNNEQHLLYKSFNRLSNSLKSHGLGIGLTITRNYVRLLGGEIRSVSKKGEGSCFIVDIPLAKQHRSSYTNVLPNINVLLCENVLSNIGEMLTNLNISYDICSDLKDVAQKISQKSYHLLITDSYILETAALELLTEIRKMNVGNSSIIPVIVFTASNIHKQKTFDTIDFCTYISKPISMVELYEEIYNCVDEYVDRIYLPDLRPLLNNEEDDVQNRLNKFLIEMEQNINDLQVAYHNLDYTSMNNVCDNLFMKWSLIHAETTLISLRRSLMDIADEEGLCLSVRAVCETANKIVKLIQDYFNKKVVNY